MNIYIISIFPEIFDSFVNTSLIKKAQEKKIIKFKLINPRDFCKDKHKQIDDTIYWWWAWMLIKAQPLIDAVEKIIKTFKTQNPKFKIIMPSPSEKIFTQKYAHTYSKVQNLIFICGRYEGIDYRFYQYIKKKYKSKFEILSLGQFITLWWEVPTMIMVEAITRLIPGVINQSQSRKNESYCLDYKMNNLEYPQYTRPEIVEWIKVPKILLSGHQKNIQTWKENNLKFINKTK
jgi:tRNA (guanine37-N1)-methyltransferase